MKIVLPRVFEIFAQQTALAAGVCFLILLALEWFMPGSVLPFVNLVPLILCAGLALTLAFLGVKRHQGIRNLFGIILGLLLATGLLALLATRVESYSKFNLILLAAGILCILAWAFGALKDE